MQKTLILFLFLITLVSAQAQNKTQVTFYTTMGDFVVELEDSLAPITAGNFLSLVSQEFYDGIIFHRVINNFIIQGGDPLGTGFGGPGYTIQDEFHPALSNTERTISMANSGPNTGGSQFFFNTVDNTFLDFDKAPLSSQHAVFGTIILGYNIVQSIENVTTNSQDKPLVDVVMDSVRVTPPVPLSINGIDISLGKVKLYPNPASNQLSFNSKKDIDRVNIISITGKIVKTLTPKANTIDISSLPNGVYFISLFSGNQKTVRKFVKN